MRSGHSVILFVSSILLCWIQRGQGRSLDMTHAFDKNTWYWPSGQSKFVLENLFKGKTDLGFWLETNQFRTGEHVGTHMDSPRHFAKKGWTQGEIPVERFIAPAVMIDIRERASQSQDANLTLDDVTSWEAEHGEIPEGAVVFQCSGWSDMYGVDKAGFWGNDREDATDFHFPGFGVEAAEWLADKRKVIGVAVDTPSTDCGSSTNFPTHQAVAKRNVYGLENVKDPCELPPRGATVYVFPMKTAEGSGGPVRIVAVWDD